MTKKELSQLYYLNREIETRRVQLENIEDELGAQRRTDTVKGSSASFPYTKQVFKVEGIADTARARRVLIERDETLEIIDNLRERAAIEYKRLTREISEIDDSLTRQVLELRYVNGLPWQQVAACIGGNNTADSVRKVAERYISAAARLS